MCQEYRSSVIGEPSSVTGAPGGLYGPGSGPEWRWAVAGAGAHTLVVPSVVQLGRVRRVASCRVVDRARSCIQAAVRSHFSRVPRVSSSALQLSSFGRPPVDNSLLSTFVPAWCSCGKLATSRSSCEPISRIPESEVGRPLISPHSSWRILATQDRCASSEGICRPYRVRLRWIARLIWIHKPRSPLFLSLSPFL